MSVDEFRRRIVVVDDESIIRFLLTSLLEQSGFECWPAENAVEAIRLMRKVDPDVAIVDLDLGSGASGAELITAIRLENEAIGIVLLSNFLPKKTEKLALDRVVYLHKSDAQNSQVLIDAIDVSVGKGASGSFTSEIMTSDSIQSMTSNQQEVLGLLAQGKTNQEIADALGTGLRAIERTISRIYIKLGLASKPVGARRVEAARMFMLTIGSSRTTN